jgi:hypothetical protein
MPAQLSAVMFGIAVRPAGAYEAIFDAINRTALEITRPQGIKNCIYQRPEIIVPTVFAPGRVSRDLVVPFTTGVNTLVRVMDNTATAKRPAAPLVPSVANIGAPDETTGLRRVTFQVNNTHTQVMIAEGDVNEVSFGEGQPTYFSPGFTSWSVDVPQGFEVSWRIGDITASAQA